LLSVFSGHMYANCISEEPLVFYPETNTRHSAILSILIELLHFLSYTVRPSSTPAALEKGDPFHEFIP